MKSVDIVLGEKTYTVTQLPLRKNVAWQRHVAEQAKPILAAIPSLMTALSPVVKQAGASGASWLDGITDETLPALLDSGSGLLLGAIDAMPVLLDLLYEFDPALKLDVEHIEANATEEELLAAFVAIVKMSFPFGARVGDLLRSLNATATASGDTTATTSLSSPSAPGDDLTMNSTTSRLPA